MGKIGFGIIGSGGIATTAHIPSLLEISDAQLLAVANRSIEKARAAAALVDGAAAYDDNQLVIDHPGVEAVIVSHATKVACRVDDQGGASRQTRAVREAHGLLAR